MSLTNTRRGMTILEVLIIIPIVSVLTFMVYQITVNAQRSYRFAQAEAQSNFEVSNSLSRVERVIRGLSDIESASPTSITFYGYFSPRDATPDKIHYYLDAGNNLKVGVIPATGTAPDYTYNPASEKTIVVVKNIQIGSTSLFRYFDDTNTQLSASPTPSAIKAIGITLGFNYDPKILPNPVIQQTTVNLRNRKTNL